MQVTGARLRPPCASWPANRVARLRLLWRRGLSTAEIGRLLGVSKNAVVGKIDRLELPPPSAELQARKRRHAGRPPFWLPKFWGTPAESGDRSRAGYLKATVFRQARRLALPPRRRATRSFMTRVITTTHRQAPGRRWRAAMDPPTARAGRGGRRSVGRHWPLGQDHLGEGPPLDRLRRRGRRIDNGGCEIGRWFAFVILPIFVVVLTGVAIWLAPYLAGCCLDARALAQFALGGLRS